MLSWINKAMAIARRVSSDAVFKPNQNRASNQACHPYAGGGWIKTIQLDPPNRKDRAGDAEKNGNEKIDRK